ncbi:TM2 domain-containing protein [Bifidobacterium sp.]|jgi:TM2 domain-containing membrane protein YozV|uniref:TM2 domain-containing protein n=1 Tax=Bifidobacterium sp. TaxID=41200 RepID=UPI0025C27F1B|nr:TM2 domain-containing protein [Bifidobacterium sp.]MCH4208857.1 TM2 domain-containing protein [Bifidobacterium sp.]MCI1225480.1 TM2 domain-containing protein [Bifidobacterium sp.]
MSEFNADGGQQQPQDPQSGYGQTSPYSQGAAPQAASSQGDNAYGRPEQSSYGQQPYGGQTDARGPYYAPPQATQGDYYGQAYGQQGQQNYSQPGYSQQGYGMPQNIPYGYVPRQKLVAGLLAIFLGSLGVHNFYLGYTGKGLIQLLLTLVGWMIVIGPMVAGIWALIEGILILCSNYGSPWHRDAKGVELRD